jgi:hypothetical protein
MQGSYTEKIVRTKPPGFGQRDPKRDRRRKKDYSRQREAKRGEQNNA